MIVCKEKNFKYTPLARKNQIDYQSMPASMSTAIHKEESVKIIGDVKTFRDLCEIKELSKKVFGKSTYCVMVTRNRLFIDIVNTLPTIAQSNVRIIVAANSDLNKKSRAGRIQTAYLLSGSCNASSTPSFAWKAC